MLKPGQACRPAVALQASALLSGGSSQTAQREAEEEEEEEEERTVRRRKTRGGLYTRTRSGRACAVAERSMSLPRPRVPKEKKRPYYCCLHLCDCCCRRKKGFVAATLAGAAVRTRGKTSVRGNSIKIFPPLRLAVLATPLSGSTASSQSTVVGVILILVVGVFPIRRGGPFHTRACFRRG